jgi:hypothetical protein
MPLAGIDNPYAHALTFSPPLRVDFSSMPMSIAEYPVFEDLDVDLDTIFESIDPDNAPKNAPIVPIPSESTRKLADAEAELVEEVGLDPKYVGDHIATGVESVVYHYQDSKVVKLPRGAVCTDAISRVMTAIMGKTRMWSNYHYLICQNRFGETVEKTEYYWGKTERRYATVQQYQELEKLEPHEVRYGGEFREPIKLLLVDNGELYREHGLCFDFAGCNLDDIMAGAPFMNNVSRLKGTKRLSITDTGLLDSWKHIPQICFQEWNMSKYDLDLFGREEN